MPKPKGNKTSKGDSKEATREIFPQPNQDIMYIIGGLESYEINKKQNLEARCVFTVEPTHLSSYGGQRFLTLLIG
jgi:hypothetical protein